MRECFGNLIVVTLIVPIALSGAQSFAGTPHPFEGTWVLNLQRSKDANPGRLPQSEILHIQEREGGLTLTADQVYPQEKPLHVEYSVKYDGKDYPVKGSPTADTVALKRINSNTIETTRRRNGKVLFTFSTVISKDGKTRTSTFEGRNVEGKPVSWIAVFDKQ
jgi:hypothetical protein